jgi:hypothetical protein
MQPGPERIHQAPERYGVRQRRSRTWSPTLGHPNDLGDVVAATARVGLRRPRLHGLSAARGLPERVADGADHSDTSNEDTGLARASAKR